MAIHKIEDAVYPTVSLEDIVKTSETGAHEGIYVTTIYIP